MSNDKPSQKDAAGAAQSTRKRVTSALGLDELMQVTNPRNWLALTGLLIAVAAIIVWSFLGSLPRAVTGSGLLLRPNGGAVVSPVDGLVTAIRVADGDTVAGGDEIAEVTQADGTQTPVTTVISGTVTGVNVAQGLQTRQGATLASVEQLNQPLSVVAYLPLTSGKVIDPGMVAQITPGTADVESYGYLLGTVTSVSDFPVTSVDIAGLFGTDTLAEDFLVHGPVIQIIVTLKEDAANESGYQWSSSSGPPFQLKSGTPVKAQVITAEQRPIDLILGR